MQKKGDMKMMNEEQRTTEMMRTEAITSPRYREYRFQESDNSPVCIFSRYYANHFDTRKENETGILFFGGTGVGKTYYAASIVNSLVDRGIPCLLIQEERAVANILSDGKEYLDSLNRYRLVVLDDINWTINNNLAASAIYQLIDSRYRNKLPIIVTTILDAEEIKNPKTGTQKQIFSRLKEMCTPVYMYGEDKRIIEADKEHALLKKMLGMQ